MKKVLHNLGPGKAQTGLYSYGQVSYNINILQPARLALIFTRSI